MPSTSTRIINFLTFFKHSVATRLVMEVDKRVTDDHQEEEEYVLLDLDTICGQVDIPPNEPYVLSDLDTLNPVLTIGDKLKLIEEYEETIGTCLIFSEKVVPVTSHRKDTYSGEETGDPDSNLYKGATILDPSHSPSKELKPVTSLHKILKFRLLSEDDEQDFTETQGDLPVQGETITDFTETQGDV